MVTWKGISRLPGFCYSCSWMSARSIQDAIPGFHLLFHQMVEAQSQELCNRKQLSMLVVVVVSEKMCCDSVHNLIFSSICQMYSRRVWDYRGSRRAGYMECKVDPLDSQDKILYANVVNQSYIWWKSPFSMEGVSSKGFVISPDCYIAALFSKEVWSFTM